MPKSSAPTVSSFPESLHKLGLSRWVDLVLHFPSRYDNESQLWTLDQVVPGQFAQVQVVVISSRIQFRPRRMLVVEVEDSTGRALLRFLHFKDAQKNAFPSGQKLRVLGDARRSLAGVEFIHPRIRAGWMDPSTLEAKPLVPVYPTTAGVSQINLRRWVHQALLHALPREWLSASMLESNGLMPLPDAIRLIHEPPANAQDTGLMSELSQREGAAWNRIRFDELLAQQVVLRRARLLKMSEQAPALIGIDLLAQLRTRLPFELTQAQQRVWQEVSSDLARTTPMQRLLQGDVGSGKTVIAVMAAAQAVSSGYQVAVMAPTEILAEQLAQKFSEWLAPLGISMGFLKGGLPAKLRRELLAGFADGSLSVAVGTHALIQKGVAFAKLGLVVVDEQHRFGVGQRLALREGGKDREALRPHLLGMSATPIPRSLAMTYLADLDVSVIDERPPNRQPILTKLMSSTRRDELLQRLSQFIAEGHQAYWVCPLIEGDDESTIQAIDTTAQWLAPVFGEQLQILHGRMTAEEKKEAMTGFRDGHKRLLLATTVIEVGVDVPQATLMVIEHAERFGLAQLHQLRGRVGRGAGQSTCILLFDEPLSDLARERLKTLYETDDGFEVARRDLAIRGPGEFLGLRQSGVPALQYSDLQKDALWVEKAVAFGAKLAQGLGAPDDLQALGVKPEDIDQLMERWAYGKETLLASG